MAIKKRQKAQKKIGGGFLTAAKIAADLGRKKSIVKEKFHKAGKAKENISDVSKTKETKTTVVIKEETVKTDFSKKSGPNVLTPYSRVEPEGVVKGKSLSEIGSKINSSGELVGFNDLKDDEVRYIERAHENFSLFKDDNGDLVPVIGGAAMILILIELIVLVIILVVMFVL